MSTSTASRRLTVEEAVAAIAQGRMVIVTDDENRENEGDFVFAASAITPEKVNFLLRHARGMICVPMSRRRQAQLELFPMVERNTEHQGTNFTVTVDARAVSTGISAQDRYLTIKALADEVTRPEDLLRPGHINPLIGRDGGVLVRTGHTEASLDLCRLAGKPEVAVICEILNEDGSMARMADLERVAAEHDLGILTIEDLIAYRKKTERLVRHVVTAKIPNPFGLWDVHLFENSLTGDEVVALVLGDPASQDSALIRVHSKCFTGDVLLSQRCDCGPQLLTAMSRIAAEGHGVIVYMNQEGRGIGLRSKLMAYNLQDQGQDTVQANESLGFKADLREYGIGAQILAHLGLRRIRIMTNNPKKMVGISGFGLEVVGREPLVAGVHEHNDAYLKTKAEKLGHLFDADALKSAAAAGKHHHESCEATKKSTKG